jgi:hypothetical protein
MDDQGSRSEGAHDVGSDTRATAVASDSRVTDVALVVRDVLDGQLLSSDIVRLARVADVELASDDDGGLRVAAVAIGPEALGRRIAARVGRFLGRVLDGRFDHRIGLEEIVEIGPWIRLRGTADDYDIGARDRWLADHLLRFVPGSGVKGPKRRRTRRIAA